jgi:hypothetical protein
VHNFQAESWLLLKVPFSSPLAWLEETGADPTIVSYNAGDVKIYSDTSSLARFLKTIMDSSVVKEHLKWTQFRVEACCANKV